MNKRTIRLILGLVIVLSVGLPYWTWKLQHLPSIFLIESFRELSTALGLICFGGLWIVYFLRGVEETAIRRELSLATAVFGLLLGLFTLGLWISANDPSRVHVAF